MTTAVNTATLDALYATETTGLPGRDSWTGDDRYLVIGEEVHYETVERRFGGAWSTIVGALESYDWNAGVPVCLIDLFAEPARSTWGIVLTPTVGHGPQSIEDVIA